jgi:hypothetical protein
MMKDSCAMVLENYCQVHRDVLAFTEKLSEEKMTWQATPKSLSIAFFLWHLARWADHLQAAIPGMTPELSRRLPPGQQLWETGNYSANWGFDAGITGYSETGMGMEMSEAARLVFPSKEALIAYVRQVFDAAEKAVYAIDEGQFLSHEQPQGMTEGIRSEGGTVGSAVMGHLVHASRHLGMMECLLGLQIDSGTATV